MDEDTREWLVEAVTASLVAYEGELAGSRDGVARKRYMRVLRGRAERVVDDLAGSEDVVLVVNPDRGQDGWEPWMARPDGA